MTPTSTSCLAALSAPGDVFSPGFLAIEPREYRGAVTAQAISKYEAAKMMPSSAVLVSLGQALDVSLDFLMSAQVEVLDGLEFRKDSSTSTRDRAKAEAVLIDNLARYLEWCCPVFTDGWFLGLMVSTCRLGGKRPRPAPGSTGAAPGLSLAHQPCYIRFELPGIRRSGSR